MFQAVSFAALKTDRDRLKLDKAELLSQIQETQKTIDDKEEQLREFIRDFNQQMKVSSVASIVATRLFFVCLFLVAYLSAYYEKAIKAL